MTLEKSEKIFLHLTHITDKANTQATMLNKTKQEIKLY